MILSLSDGNAPPLPPSRYRVYGEDTYEAGCGVVYTGGVVFLL